MTFPRGVYAGLRSRIERSPAVSGIVAPVLRDILCAQVFTALAACLIGAALLPVSAAPLAFGAGAAVSAFNFRHTARFVQTHLSEPFSAALHCRLFFGFCTRLALTGAALYLLLVPCGLPAVPLLLGLGSTVAGIVLRGLSKLSGKSFKEA
jgi:hypothetical protein